VIEYLLKYSDKLGTALIEHLVLVSITLIISLFMAAILTLLAMRSRLISKLLVYTFSVVYSVPSLALFAILIPVTGLGKVTAIVVLVLYNQYLLLRNFIAGLNDVDASIIESAMGMGMTDTQILMKIRIPLSKRAIFTGIHLAIVSTIGIATIAASINAGGLGTILFDGLRTMNVNKIVWGSILAAGLAVSANYLLGKIEKAL
jgi:osmoprotectant transport system permease protein